MTPPITLPRLLVLASLSKGPAYAGELRRRVEQHTGGAHVLHESTIRSSLAVLERADLVERVAAGRTLARARRRIERRPGGRAPIWWRLTPDGRRVYRAHAAGMRELFSADAR